MWGYSTAPATGRWGNPEPLGDAPARLRGRKPPLAPVTSPRGRGGSSRSRSTGAMSPPAGTDWGWIMIDPKILQKIYVAVSDAIDEYKRKYYGLPPIVPIMPGDMPYDVYYRMLRYLVTLIVTGEWRRAGGCDNPVCLAIFDICRNAIVSLYEQGIDIESIMN